MFALLFDRRSLIVTGVALAGVAGLLFAAGVVTGLNLRRERVVVPPYWLKYGPVETSDVRGSDRFRGAGPTVPSAAATGLRQAGAGSGQAGSGQAGSGQAGSGAAGDTTTPQDWVPFSKPGDPTLPDPSAGDGGVRAKPPAGATTLQGVPPGGAAQGDAAQGGAGQGGAKQDVGGVTLTPPPAGGAGDDGGAASDSGSGTGSVDGSEGAGNAGATGPATGAEAPPATTRLAAAGCPEPGQPTWYVQTGAYAVAGNAQHRHDSLQARFAADGPRPYLHRTVSSSGVELTLVRLGPFATRQAARRAAAALDDAFVGVEAGAPGGCGGEDTMAGRGQEQRPGTVTLAARVTPVG